MRYVAYDEGRTQWYGANAIRRILAAIQETRETGATTFNSLSHSNVLQMFSNVLQMFSNAFKSFSLKCFTFSVSSFSPTFLHQHSQHPMGSLQEFPIQIKHAFDCSPSSLSGNSLLFCNSNLLCFWSLKVLHLYPRDPWHLTKLGKSIFTFTLFHLFHQPTFSDQTYFSSYWIGW